MSSFILLLTWLFFGDCHYNYEIPDKIYLEVLHSNRDQIKFYIHSTNEASKHKDTINKALHSIHIKESTETDWKPAITHGRSEKYETKKKKRNEIILYPVSIMIKFKKKPEIEYIFNNLILNYENKIYLLNLVLNSSNITTQLEIISTKTNTEINTQLSQTDTLSNIETTFNTIQAKTTFTSLNTTFTSLKTTLTSLKTTLTSLKTTLKLVKTTSKINMNIDINEEKTLFYMLMIIILLSIIIIFCICIALYWFCCTTREEGEIGIDIIPSNDKITDNTLNPLTTHTNDNAISNILTAIFTPNNKESGSMSNVPGSTKHKKQKEYMEINGQTTIGNDESSSDSDEMYGDKIETKPKTKSVITLN